MEDAKQIIIWRHINGKRNGVDSEKSWADILFSAASAFSQVGPFYSDHTISTVAVPINNWNMYSSRTHYITLDDYSNPKRPKYLNPQNIVGVEAVIRDDAGGKLLNFTGHRSGNYLWGGWFHLHCYTYNNACQIQLDRGPRVASRFGNTEYDAAGHRGYVLIQYHSPDTTVQAVHTHWQELGGWNMNGCTPGSFCLNPSFPSGITPVITANMGADIHSDYEPIPQSSQNLVTIGHFENLSAHWPNQYSFGKGGVLQMGTLLRFFMTYNQMSRPEFFSRFKTTRYDGSSNRGYMRLQHVRSTTANARQPFVIKSKYQDIGPWCFSDPLCNSNSKSIDASYLFTNPERIVAVNSAIMSDTYGTNPFAVTNIRRGNERDDQDGLNQAGGKIQGEVIANIGPGFDSFHLELTNPASKHWGRWPHATSQHRGWSFLQRCRQSGHGRIRGSQLVVI